MTVTCEWSGSVFTERGRGGVIFLRRSSRPAVLRVRTSWRIQSPPAVDTGSADSASPRTGTSLVLQETPPVPSVDKDPDQELELRQPVRAALYMCLLMSSLLTSAHVVLFCSFIQHQHLTSLEKHKVKKLLFSVVFLDLMKTISRFSDSLSLTLFLVFQQIVVCRRF